MRQITLANINLSEALAEACAVLATGGLVIYPTETLYGIGADATNPQAVERLLSFKNRPAGKAISVLVADQRMAERLVSLNDTAKQLYATYLPGPMTVISQSKSATDPRLESEFGTLGIRISSHPIAKALALAYGKPISATSANASGKARPYDVQTALDGLTERQKNLVGLILDTGTLPRNEPSTVVDTTQNTQEIVRAGSNSAALLEQITTVTPEETIALAKKLTLAWKHVLPYRPLVFALLGPLGAGKTQFAKGVAEALEIAEPVTSPSYTLVKEYPGLIHMDLWRTPEVTPAEIGLDDYLKPGNVLVVEWATPLLTTLQEQREAVTYLIELDPLSERERQISIREL